MKESDLSSQFESRWPVVLAVVAVTALLALLPGRIRLLPVWGTYALCAVVLVPIMAVGLISAREQWLRIERAVILGFFIVTAVGTIANLSNLVHAIVWKSEGISGMQLLASGVAVWVTNVVIFSLFYWQMDRGGPEGRVRRTGKMTDWLFPQEAAPEGDVPAGWRPVFVDYLYLSYSTATAFSTTEVMPLTSRAKLLMMLQSSISLVTIVIVASRAINILG